MLRGLSNTVDQAKLSMKISQRRGSPKACCAIVTEVGVVLALFVQQNLKEIRQACLNKMAYRDRLLSGILA